MRIYLTTQGTRVIREGSHLLVKKDTTTYHTLFVDKIEQLLVFGNIELTPPARSLLLSKGVDTVFLTRDGRYRGRFELPEPKNIFLRIKQFDLLHDKEFGLDFARRVVEGKLRNMMVLLHRMKRKKKIKKPGFRAGEIKKLLSGLVEADSISTIRGYEGLGSAHYFSVFGRGLDKDFGFRQRVRRPPTDPVNSVLSLLYTFLYNRVYAAIRINHLDPYPAFLHTPDYGRTSLALDLMEEFRVIIVDSLTLSLFNLSILKEQDFHIDREQIRQIQQIAQHEKKHGDISVLDDPYGYMNDTGSSLFEQPVQRMDDHPAQKENEDRGKLPVRLIPEAFNRVLESFERKMATEFYYEPYGRKITYGDALIAQAGEYRKLVEGKLAHYTPLLIK